MGRLLGVDHGDRRIGLALSDPIPMIASPLKTVTINNYREGVEAVMEIVKKYEVILVVIGNPIGLKGNDTAQTKHVKKFAEDLQKSNIDIALIDERLSSVSAKKSWRGHSTKFSRNKGLVDQTAAAILLQQYIDTYYNG